jgi:two-component system C4-dicarboxylate transport sensor histidine kinase DctB
MFGTQPKFIWAVGAVISVALAIAAAVWHLGYVRAVEQVHARAQSDLALASDRLQAQLQRYQEVAVLMANHPALVRVTHPDASPQDQQAARDVLRAAADKTGAVTLTYIAVDGTILASATPEVSRAIATAPHYRRALTGALGVGHGDDPVFGKRVFYYASPLFGAKSGVRAVLIVTVDVDRIEARWRGTRPTVFFVDEGGHVFISNRSELLGWLRDQNEVGLHPPQKSAGSDFASHLVAGQFEVWSLNWGPYVPRRALHISNDLPTIEMRAEALVDLSPAMRVAWLQSFGVGASILLFGMVLILVWYRRDALAQENIELEHRVSERTAELSIVNQNLRSEIRERQEAEAALKQAQSELVRAGKLSALGQMSAGISHELNQPLMAIQQYAMNARTFLTQDNPQIVADNLDHISNLSQRMARIIKNLRAFARNEHEPVGRVDAVSVIDSAIELMSVRCKHDGIILNWTAPRSPVFVVAGEVRLGQVIVNLISNAADAMLHSASRAITITLVPSYSADQPVVLSVADTGPGISEPEKIFDPFYTTKSVGQGDGMGLGLSISYGLIQSFGGDIRGENTDDGAIFSIDLKPWTDTRDL